MPAPDNARQGHVILRVVLMTLALAVLVASAAMWWWMQETDDGGFATGQATASAEVDVSRG
ncbi:hypothetical protein [Dyella telluris]|uniref:Uncharacterized protein n=1 Tax=Dyella telluris TaxID=2763498 RepID=A0A7G8Q824_9GAMM|nr:hypothetical protein [Dyella telluris]QNK02932.1 hypothetical protein H8F01_07415 [Dyella telluris]